MSVKGDIIKNKLTCNGNNQSLLKDLSKIVPLNSTVNDSVVSIYQLDDFGGIKKLPDYKGLPSDENYLNNFLAESNDLFINLMEIEEKCR
ncbi:hypothetical protein MHK_001849 [Candidatus Magnetomorum sp. HK-1]|nr:hypothetical protein MHK_001849 [Candidatus Magnetomorum sp. HK-1]